MAARWLSPIGVFIALMVTTLLDEAFCADGWPVSPAKRPDRRPDDLANSKELTVLSPAAVQRAGFRREPFGVVAATTRMPSQAEEDALRATVQALGGYSAEIEHPLRHDNLVTLVLSICAGVIAWVRRRSPLVSPPSTVAPTSQPSRPSARRRAYAGGCR